MFTCAILKENLAQDSRNGQGPTGRQDARHVRIFVLLQRRLQGHCPR